MKAINRLSEKKIAGLTLNSDLLFSIRLLVEISLLYPYLMRFALFSLLSISDLETLTPRSSILSVTSSSISASADELKLTLIC